MKRVAEAFEGTLPDHIRPALDAWHRLGLVSSLSDLAGRNHGELSAALATAARRR